jgi:hypothetical protein
MRFKDAKYPGIKNSENRYDAFGKMRFNIRKKPHFTSEIRENFRLKYNKNSQRSIAGWSLLNNN